MHIACLGGWLLVGFGIGNVIMAVWLRL